MTNNTIQPIFTMLVGIPGAGKSTWAKKNISANTYYFSSDEIRKELYGDENFQGDPAEVFSLMQRRTVESLKSGFNVIYDATNVSRKNRRGILHSLPKNIKKCCVIIWAPIEICIERDKVRARTVGEAIINKMLHRFEAPFFDEGFDDILIVNTFEEHNSLSYYADIIKAIDIPHDNPHHTKDILAHCQECGQYLLKNYTELPSDLIYAGFVHDIGKARTKSFTNTKGEPTEIAHYYNHQAVGAYMSYGLPESSVFLAWAISSHMAPFINLKYYNRLSSDYKYYIEKLHEADRSAH